MKNLVNRYTLTGILFLLLAAGCANSGNNTSNAVGAIEAYNEALVAKNADQLSTLSCAAWEADAKNELDSFSAVTVTLNDIKCEEAGKDGNTTLVTCTGDITANYGNEVLKINLADRTYQAVYEGGEWRMCGYR
jgi:hypothetical protein